MYRYPDAIIMVFCKAPIPGEAKTRLIPYLSPEQAADLHCELTERTLQIATQNNLCKPQLWCTPDAGHPFFIGLESTYQIELKLQQGKDLGERMSLAFDEALSRYKAAIIIGCDCPSLMSDDLDQALAYLSRSEPCVLAPAEDGGYVLIGLTQQFDFLFFDVCWGTQRVFDITQARLKAHQLSYKLLPTQWDVDTASDLERYLKWKEISQGNSE